MMLVYVIICTNKDGKGCSARNRLKKRVSITVIQNLSWLHYNEAEHHFDLIAFQNVLPPPQAQLPAGVTYHYHHFLTNRKTVQLNHRLQKLNIQSNYWRDTCYVFLVSSKFTNSCTTQLLVYYRFKNLPRSQATNRSGNEAGLVLRLVRHRCSQKENRKNYVCFVSKLGYSFCLLPKETA